MSAPTPEARRDPRLDAGGEDHPGLAKVDRDQAALRATRLGLRIAAPGMLLVLLGVVPVEAEHLGGPMLAIRAVGWSLLALGLALTAPTPNGPLPGWLRIAYVLVCGAGAARVVYDRFFDHAQFAVWESRVVWLQWIFFQALPWILWRFCQYRGLTGRAITWLWCAFALLGVFGANLVSRSSWALWLCPIIGVVLWLNARQTARDV